MHSYSYTPTMPHCTILKNTEQINKVPEKIQRFCRFPQRHRQNFPPGRGIQIRPPIHAAILPPIHIGHHARHARLLFQLHPSSAPTITIQPRQPQRHFQPIHHKRL
jgi:hypothetical protein